MAFKVDPMKIDLILTTIFDFCTVPTLKNCRLVSKKWRDLSLKTWREKAVLRLDENERESNRNRNHNARESDSISVTRYINMLWFDTFQLRRYPMVNFHFQYSLQYHEIITDYAERIWSIARHVKLSKFNLTFLMYSIFLNKFRSLETLELERSLISTPSSPSHPFMEIEMPPRSHESLKRLRISNLIGRDRDCAHLLLPFPSLESLSIVHTETDVLQFMVLQILDWVSRKELTLLNLKEFEMTETSKNMGCRLESTIMGRIADCKFPLERLTIDVVWTGKESEVMSSICKLLESSKDTLKYFKISSILHSYLEVVNDTRYRNNKRWPTHFRMEKLKKLRMVNGLPLGFNVLTQIDMPNLETLILEYNDRLSGMGEHRLEVAFPKGKVFEKLEVLEIFDHGALLKPKVIKDMAKGMPNLVKLTVPVDRDAFREVCKHFGGLKILRIIPRQCRYDFDLDEETLTGLSKRSNNKGGSKQPNITDLTSLRDLSICCEAQLKRNDVKFGDHSVIHGFLKLPRLHSLSIAFKELSRNVKAKLLKHLHGNVHFQTKSALSK